MHIGEVATRTELSLRSLRHWEEVGLLRPSGRTDGGFRLYTEADVDKILVIRRMKPLGFSIEEMKAVMSDLEALDDPRRGRRLPRRPRDSGWATSRPTRTSGGCGWCGSSRWPTSSSASSEQRRA